MKIKLLVAREIQYFELGIFSFNLYVYHITRGCIASTRAYNLVTRAFDFPTRAFSLPTRAFRDFTHGFELVTRRFEVVIHGFELVTRGFELVTRALLFHDADFHKGQYYDLFFLIFVNDQQYATNA